MSILGIGRKNGKKTAISAMTQNITFNRRSLLLGGSQAAIGMLLAGRMAYIAVAENERYQVLAESNRVNLSLIPPRRGWIVDRNGKPLANNKADFRVDIIPNRLTEGAQTVSRLADLLDLPAEEVERINTELEDADGFQPVAVASGLSYDQFAAINVRIPDLPGVAPLQGFSRQYPGGAAVGHLLGYVGIANAKEYEAEKIPLLVTPGFKLGKDGLEKQFEQILRGEPGAKRVEVTARGKVVRELETRPDTPGAPVKLTIDGDLQRYAGRRIGPESGSVIVMDCVTGDILCLASMPSFDPNSFSDGIGVDEYAMLRNDDHVPLRNKSLVGLYPPGSTVKPMNTLAFLKAGIDPSETVVCRGGLRVGSRFFRCHSTHGTVNMNRAVAQSCDTYFYYFAQRIGMDPVATMMREHGLGLEYDLPVNNQFYGTVPDPAWLQRKHKRRWTTADTANASIGQGYVLTNPLQLTVMTARIASGRELTPNLLMSKRKKQQPAMQIAPEHLELARAAMRDVVHGAGTARRAALPLPNIEVAGKTGTAQVVSLTRGDGRNVPWKFRDHGLFVCFAPYDNPRYACAVVIEHGGGSGAAYPVARDVLTFLFDRDKAEEAIAPLERAWGGTIEERMEKQFARFQANKAAAAASEASEQADQESDPQDDSNQNSNSAEQG
ncbi:penicillin-binding protein 2 [Parasphingorhabdus sp. DH2-15]|uniref:penicillin-binding protein 2 n=1 Tax=Parasphingorhabdus sp. DH2-15 TaxID=3444112 RepID=UPI003F687850